MHLLETEGIAIEPQRAFEIKHPNHGVDEFGHLRVFSMQGLPQVTGLPEFNRW
jgi:hypothetical protein